MLINLLELQIFKIDSYTEDTFLTILRKGSAVNGSKMTIVGDALALKDLLPASNLTRILLTDAYNTTLGYMDVWNTYNVIGFDVADDQKIVEYWFTYGPGGTQFMLLGSNKYR